GPQPRLSCRQSWRPRELHTCVPRHRLRRHLSPLKLPTETSERTQRLSRVAPSPHPSKDRKAARGSPVASFATNNPESSGAGSSSPTTIDWIRDTFEKATGCPGLRFLVG
ncbi:unnamed protein product, partial [Ixodes pacificus]